MDFNIETYIELKKKFNSVGIKVDIGDSDFVKLIDFANNGTDEDFIITLERIEYENLRFNEYKELKNSKLLSTKETLYLHVNKFSDFCYSLKRFNNNSLKEFMLEYDEVLE